MKRVALYARVSTPDQDPEPQLDRLREWVKRQGFEVALEEADVASGRNSNRAGLDHIMRRARGHHVHAVAVVKIDRWARSLLDLRRTIEELHGLGVDFHAVGQGLRFNPNDSMSKALVNFLGIIAELEADLISERTKEALEARRRSGVKLGRPRKVCRVCGQERRETLYAKVSGDRVPVCGSCKQDSPEARRATIEGGQKREGAGAYT